MSFLSSSKKRRERGFSLLEATIVTLLIVVSATVAIIQMKASITIIDADRACNLVSSQLQYARQVAVNQRRNVLVEFLGTNEVKVTRLDPGGATTVLADVFLPSGFSFSMPTGIDDTPEGYGNAEAVDFNANAHALFLADGILVDDADVVMNGTVFTMGGNSGTARAVTVTGASSRIRVYWLEGATWTERI